MTLGSGQGQKGEGLERGKRRKMRALQASLLLLYISKMPLEPPTWDTYFQSLSI